MKRRWNTLKGSALPTVMVITIAIGIYTVALAQSTTAMRTTFIKRDKDQTAFLAAAAAMEYGRSLLYYRTLGEFRDGMEAYADSGDPIDLNPRETGVQPIARLNDYFVQIRVEHNLLDVTRDNDTDLRFKLISMAWDSSGRQVRLGQEFTVQSAADFNFASTRFGYPYRYGGERHWYGKVFLANLWDGSLLQMNATQHYHGQVYAMRWGEEGRTNRARFYKEFSATEVISEQDAIDRGQLVKYDSLADMPQLPTNGAEYLDQMDPGGALHEVASRVNPSTGQNRILGDDPGEPKNAEIYLHTDGKVYYRPFGGSPDFYNAATNPNGWKEIGSQDDGVILIQGNATVRGFATGRAVIAATGSVSLNGNIENLDPAQAHVGVMAAGNIYFENREVKSQGDSYRIRPPRRTGYSVMENGSPEYIGFFNSNGGSPDPSGEQEPDWVWSATDPNGNHITSEGELVSDWQAHYERTIDDLVRTGTNETRAAELAEEAANRLFGVPVPFDPEDRYIFNEALAKTYESSRGQNHFYKNDEGVDSGNGNFDDHYNVYAGEVLDNPSDPNAPIHVQNTFNFLAREVFSNDVYQGIKNAGDPVGLAKALGLDNPLSEGGMGLDLDTIDKDVLTELVDNVIKGTLRTYQEDNGNQWQKGRMPRRGAKVEASIVASTYITPSLTGGSDRVNMGGGHFYVAGTYSLGIGSDWMATWSGGGGYMGYDRHPFQLTTAPQWFLPVQQAYPRFLYGTWERLPNVTAPATGGETIVTIEGAGIADTFKSRIVDPKNTVIPK